MNQIRPHWALWDVTPYKVWRDSGIRNPGLWNSLFNSRKSGIPHRWQLESGIQLVPLKGIRNSVNGMRNPQLENQIQNSKNVLDDLTWGERWSFATWGERWSFATWGERWSFATWGKRWSFATSETRRLLEPKCVPQLILGSLLGTFSTAIGQFFPSLVTVPEVFAKVNSVQFPRRFLTGEYVIFYPFCDFGAKMSQCYTEWHCWDCFGKTNFDPVYSAT